MTITTKGAEERFRMQPRRGAEGVGVDFETNSINGAVAMQLGKLNEGDSRNWLVDDATLDQLVKFGNRNKRKGIKSRFAHPNLSDDGMGTYLGDSGNFRRDGDVVRVDLEIDEVAFNSPRGDLGTYTLMFANNKPDKFGMSAVLNLDLDDLRRHEREQFVEGTDEPWPIRMKGLKAVDVVDDPAATRTGMFASFELGNDADLAGIVTEILDAHFDTADRDVILGRFEALLDRYLRNKGGTPMPADKTPEPADLKTQTDPPADPTPTPEPATLQPATLDTSAVRSAGASDEKTRQKKIRALCQLANADPEQFIDADFSVEETQSALEKLMVKNNPPASDNDGGDPGTPAKDENAKFKAEYAKNRETHEALGITQEEFVTSKRISAGLESLLPSPKPLASTLKT